jgi:hypothetical protein
MSIANHGDGNFYPGTVRLVDYDKTSGNVLVRGGAAFGAANFTMAGLIRAIQRDPNFSNLPSDIQNKLGTHSSVTDFCLIGFGPDTPDQGYVQNEVDYFNSSARLPSGTPSQSEPYPVYVHASPSRSLGTMVYWPVQSFDGFPCALKGNWTGAPYPDLSILASVSGQPGYNFAGLVPAISDALTNSPPNTYAIIYVHCDSGVNRTAAAIVSYLMQYGTQLLTKPPTSPPYSLMVAQGIANSAPPDNDTTPPGGNDIQVAMAYKNYLESGRVTAAGLLVSSAVPCICLSCQKNCACGGEDP